MNHPVSRFILIVVVSICTTQLFSQTLFTYGPYAVGKDEFLRAYDKIQTPVTDKTQSLKEYLDLYYRFKLKVQTAREQQLDTLQQLKYDLQNFRSQVADGYMNDEKGLNTLMEEAIERSRKDIHLLHFYVSIPAGITAADSLKAYKAMNELAAELKKGKAGYLEIIASISKKYVEIKEKDLGYCTVFSLPYDIENLVYATRPGAITKLVRTQSALHIFKNVDERKNAGKWKIAQILLAIPPNATTAELNALGVKADSIYNLLMAGSDFSTLAMQLSEDKITYMKGGEMPEFGSGKFDLSFETRVFAIKKDGEISKPILASDGYHIVKRLQRSDLAGDKSDDTFITQIKQQILQDERMNSVRAAFLKTIQQRTGYKINVDVKETDLFRYADSVTANGQVGNYSINNKTIFSFAKWKVRGSDWLNFVKDYKLNIDVYKGENNSALLEKYIATASFDYYRKHLEEYNPGFKHQMQEFKEGNLLFEIMERNVWGKASNDSIGLQKYFNLHQENYKWVASADVVLFNCSDSIAAENAARALRNGKKWRQVMEESEGKLQSDSGRYELAQLPLPAGTILTEGLLSATYINSGDKTSSFVKVVRMFPANEQRSFDEARGLVINDYQNSLEEKWVEALKKKYPLKVNEVVFDSLLK